MAVVATMSDQMRAVLRKAAALAPSPNGIAADIMAERDAFIAERHYWNEGGPVMAYSRDDVIATPDGNVPVRYHLPTLNDSAPTIVYFHGGGFILGNLDTHDRIMRTLAHESYATVVGVDYSLLPEADFAMTLRQCTAVVRRLLAGERGVDPCRIGLAGDASGAGLALSTCLSLCNDAGPSVIALLLFDGRFDNLTDDMAGLPPVFIGAAELDQQGNGSDRLAETLKSCGLEYHYACYPGVLHGFLQYSRHLDEAGQALREGGEFFHDMAIRAIPSTLRAA